jgi:hypothetical protein
MTTALYQLVKEPKKGPPLMENMSADFTHYEPALDYDIDHTRAVMEPHQLGEYYLAAEIDDFISELKSKLDRLYDSLDSAHVEANQIIRKLI